VSGILVFQEVFPMHAFQRRISLLLAVTGAIVVTYYHGRGFEVIPTAEAATDSGPVSIKQMGGDINVSDAPNGASLMTMGGNIHLGNVGSFAKVKTMGGDVAIDHANGSVDATTMGGKITIKDTNGSIDASTMAGDVTAHMVGSSAGRRDIKLSSMGGTIVLVVPKDFAMDLRVTLAYTKSAGDHFRIINPFGLSQRESDDWDSSNGTPRKYIRATGRVGSGLNHVEINTINGDVILKQE
jgi:DUF4097 and DUF4098 domain-containing protein YvlB